MNVASLIETYRGRGVTFALNDNGEVKVRGPKLSDDEKAQLRAIKSDIARYLSTLPPDPKDAPPSIGDHPQDWRDAFDERAAIREFEGLYPRAEAETLAFGEIVNAWHFQHAVITQGQCAGCGHPADDDVIRLADSADVHIGCVRAYGLKWRRTASEALERMGLTIPGGWTV